MPPPEDAATSTADDNECFCSAEFTTPNAGDVFNSDHLGCPHCRKFDPSPSSSSSSNYSDTLSVINSDQFRRIISASLKGLAIGAGLKGGIALFSLIARLTRRKFIKEWKCLEWGRYLIGDYRDVALWPVLGTFAGEKRKRKREVKKEKNGEKK